MYKTEYLGALKHICNVNLHIWTGFGVIYMQTHVGRKQRGCRKKVNIDSHSGQNEFLQRLAEKTACNEHCTIDFTVKVKDRTAPVHFFINK